jgi:hypothetical protein
MTTKLTAKNKLEALNRINQAITLANLAYEGVFFSIGSRESVKLSELESLNWNDLRRLLKNLDSVVFSYELEKGIKTDIDVQWNETTQRLIIQPIGGRSEPNQDTSEVLTVSSESSLPVTTLDLDHLSLFVAVRNTEKKLLKKKVDFSYELEELINGWLTVNKHTQKFQKTAHNALVIYPFPAYEFIIQMVKGVPQVVRRPIISENSQELRNRPRTMILKSGRPPIPEVSNILQICPIKEENNGETYLTQTYILKDDNGNYTRKSNRVAWFNKLNGNLCYYSDIELNYKQKSREQKEITRLTNSDPVIVRHLIQPLLEVGENIYPDLSIKEIKLESLVPDAVYWDREDESRQFYTTDIDNLHVLNTGDRVTSDIVQKGARLKKIAGNSTAFSPKSVLPSITFFGISHPNIEETKTPQHTKLESKKIKPYLLDGSKAVSGEMIFKGMLGTVPCIFKMIPSGRLYDIQALPIKCNPFAVALYIVGNSPKLTSIAYLQRTIAKYQSMQVKEDKLREKNELIERLKSLLISVNKGEKLDSVDILAATQTIEKYLSKASYLPLTGDNYYRYHRLGTGQFIQITNTERYQYHVNDYGKNFRKGEGSEVNSVIKWLWNCGRGLEARFGHKAAEINEIGKYLKEIFNDRFPNNSLQLSVYEENNQKFLDILYKGELEIRQSISIVAPQNARNGKKESILIPTETNFKPEFATDLEFSQFLQCSEINEASLIKATRDQVEKMVRKYVRNNYLTLTGSNNTFRETKISNLVGYESSNKGYGQIIKTFIKYVRPYLDQSAGNVLKGELISLDTLKTYSEQNARDLIGAMTNNWKQWKHRDKETIELGGVILKKPDPGVLMLAVTAAITHNPNHSQIIWRDLIDVFYQLSELSLGFRASNGCVLTPHSFYDCGIIRHTHRIKLQLIDLLVKEQRRKQQAANKSLEQIELTKITHKGSIEAWMQLSIPRLYEVLEEFDPQWKVNLANPDILTHLEALATVLSNSLKAKQIDDN